MTHHLGSFCYFLSISLLNYLHFGIFQAEMLTNPEKSQKTPRFTCYKYLICHSNERWTTYSLNDHPETQDNMFSSIGTTKADTTKADINTNSEIKATLQG